MSRGRVKNKTLMSRFLSNKKLMVILLAVVFVGAIVLNYGGLELSSFSAEYPNWNVVAKHDQYDPTHHLFVGLDVDGESVDSITLTWTVYNYDEGVGEYFVVRVVENDPMTEIFWTARGSGYAIQIDDDFTLEDEIGYIINVVIGVDSIQGGEGRFTFTYDDGPPVLDDGPDNYQTVTVTEGAGDNVVSWTFIDGTLSGDYGFRYSIHESVNYTAVESGTWASGVAIEYDINHLAKGVYHYIISVRDPHLQIVTASVTVVVLGTDGSIPDGVPVPTTTPIITIPDDVSDFSSIGEIVIVVCTVIVAVTLVISVIKER